MNKKFISLIAASIILAAPNIHAMAGYNFYFGKPKTESVPLDEYISSMLPQKLRLSQEYRDEIKYMKEELKINIPIICARTYDPKISGCAWSTGVGPLQFAIVQLNEGHMNKHSSKDSNTTTIAHELTHAERNHGGMQRAVACGFMGLLCQYLRWYATFITTTIRTGTPPEVPINLKHDFRKLKKPAALAGLALTLAIDTAYAKYTSRRSQWETEAEEGAVEKLSKLGYCSALEEQHQYYKYLSYIYPNSHRIRGDIYPTLGEYIAMTEKACKGINPAERPDTPNLMRNGTTWTQWFASFFGGGK